MNTEPIRILLLEDNPGDARLVREMLVDAVDEKIFPFEYELVHAERFSAASRYLLNERFDLMLTDLELPDSWGLETFTRIHSQSPDLPVVVLTGLADEGMGIKAVQEGAQDYLVKGQVDSYLLVRSIRYAVERQRTGKREAEKDTQKAQKKEQCPSFEMVGSSPKFKEVMGLISTVAKTSRTSVLIHGETGTGKELIANSIHYLSNRREGPFIKLNCSAIPDNLLETEMFGYEKGAFTDAKQSKKGLFELADGGTIFLDEIGDMDIRLQPKLLQILENRSFRKVGGIKDIQIDVRVVAATNKNLEEAVHEKRFREDLYYRLKVMVINLPTLRERPEDIIPISEHFIKENSASFGGHSKRLSVDSRDILLKYGWPGNIRELKNTIERALILAEASEEVRPEHLPFEILNGSRPKPHSTDFFTSGDLTLEEIEQKYILHVLNKAGGNKTRAAELLGISRLTLREKLKRSSVG
ncbi:MAG: sigma-54-dependent Fis family transcriptional regulator [Deltaproteobacteria bacterium]|nr:sigma-54-dependent Fis family transcriptional regulator [Deltaproteobacteria bacterium]